MIGDLAQPRLGVSDEDLARLTDAGVSHYFHLAAIYDMTVDDDRNRIANEQVALAHLMKGVHW